MHKEVCRNHDGDRFERADRAHAPLVITGQSHRRRYYAEDGLAAPLTSSANERDHPDVPVSQVNVTAFAVAILGGLAMAGVVLWLLMAAHGR